MESSWGLDDAPERIPSVLEPEPKDERIAFLLSLVLPGAGLIYCGERPRGRWVMGLFLLSALILTLPWVMPPGSTMPAWLWGAAFRMAIVMYGFGFLDAYFTACEKSRGIWPLQPYQPRFAAMLNLLTRGFGYWHLGHRKQGFATFFFLFLAIPALQGNFWGGLALEIIVVAVAAHAYFLGVKRNQAAIGAIDPASEPAAPVKLPESVPMVAGFVFVCLYIALQLSPLAMPDYSQINQQTAKIEGRASGAVVYTNPYYGVTMEVPEGWMMAVTNPKGFVRAARLTNDCAVELMPIALHPIASPIPIATATARAYRNARVLDSGWGPEGYRFELVIPQNGVPAHQTIHLMRSGFTVYAAVTTYLQSGKQTCEQDGRYIREHWVLP